LGEPFSSKPDMFGDSPSEAVIKAAETFKKAGNINILELGGEQGRYTLFFVRSGFNVHVLDYCQSGVETISQTADTFDGCFSHMRYCMALTTQELEFLTGEIRRVLKTGGLNIYTVRHNGDANDGTGIHRGEDMYEVGGFVVHFFSKEKVKYLAKGYDVIGVDEFEEGGLPRKLFRVTLKKE
jgi:SAM-dependent methyltransferase